MNSKRKITLVVFLVMALSPVIFCWANNNEFSREYLRITELREAKNITGLENLAKEIQNKWSQRDKQA